MFNAAPIPRIKKNNVITEVLSYIEIYLNMFIYFTTVIFGFVTSILSAITARQWHSYKNL